MSNFLEIKHRLLYSSGLFGKKVFILTYPMLKRAQTKGKKIYIDKETKYRYYINLNNYTDYEISELIPLLRLDYERRQTQTLRMIATLLAIFAVLCFTGLVLFVLFWIFH